MECCTDATEEGFNNGAEEQQPPPVEEQPVTEVQVAAPTPVSAVQEYDTEEDTRKLFVGGLAPESTRDDVQRYFTQFGEVVQCTVKTDVFTGRSRGFGFVVFRDASSVDKALAASSHELHGKFIDPKRANPKIEKSKEPVLKVFVGGVDPNATREELLEYFSKFGQVASMDLPTMKRTEERRGFIFVTFDSEEAVDKCCETAKQTIIGRECDVKKATPKQEYQKQYDGPPSGPSRGAMSRGSFAPRGGPVRGFYRGASRGARGGYGGGYGDQGYGGYGGGYSQYGSSGRGGYGYGGGYDNYGGGGYGSGYGGASGYGGGGYAEEGYWGGSGYDEGQGSVGKMRGRRGGGLNYQPY